MTEEQKLIADIATQFMIESIRQGGFSRDPYFVEQCLIQAKAIVKGAME